MQQESTKTHTAPVLAPDRRQVVIHPCGALVEELFERGDLVWISGGRNCDVLRLLERTPHIQNFPPLKIPIRGSQEQRRRTGVKTRADLSIAQDVLSQSNPTLCHLFGKIWI